MSAPFAAALIDPDAGLAGLRTWNGSDPAQRFGVYRNNVAMALRTALETTFPVTRQLVGDAFFAGMARAYSTAEPPRSPVMARYGETFADFIEGFAPARPLPYLADVARLEFLRVEAFHAADAAPIGAETFAALAPAALPQTRIALHPAVRLLRSRHPVVSIWRAHHGEAAFDTIDLDTPEDAMIARPAMAVTMHRLEPGLAAALLALSCDRTIAEAVDAGSADAAMFAPTAMFTLLLTSGSVAALLPGDGS